MRSLASAMELQPLHTDTFSLPLLREAPFLTTLQNTTGLTLIQGHKPLEHVVALTELGDLFAPTSWALELFIITSVPRYAHVPSRYKSTIPRLRATDE